MIIELLDSFSLTNREMLTNVQNAESAKLPLIYRTKFYRNTRFLVKIPETTLIAMSKVPYGYKMISFDVVNLFTNVPLNFTIDIILRKIYDEKIISTKIKREDMRKLLLLCTKKGNIYL